MAMITSKVAISKAWELYKTNVHPLINILHLETFEAMLRREVFIPDDFQLDRLPLRVNCVVVAMATAAIMSLEDEECETEFGYKRATMVASNANATNQSLVNAGFFETNDLLVLQAFTLYIICSRGYSSRRKLLDMTSNACKVARKLGIHKEHLLKEQTPFYQEISRRIWWHLAFLEGEAAQRCGEYPEVSSHDWDTKRPVNIDDSALTLPMTTRPTETPGLKEMVFCDKQHAIYEFMVEVGLGFLPVERDKWTVEWRTTANQYRQEMKNDLWAEVVKQLEHDHNVKCKCGEESVDGITDPLHFATDVFVKAIAYENRAARFNRNCWASFYPLSGMDKEQRQVLWDWNLACLRCHAYLRTDERAKRYKWHLATHRPYESLILVLFEMMENPDVNHHQGWRWVKEIYDLYPEFVMRPKNELYTRLGDLTVQSWKRCRNKFQPSSWETIPWKFIFQLEFQRVPVDAWTQAPEAHQAFLRDCYMEVPRIPGRKVGGRVALRQDWPYWRDLLESHL